MLIPNLANTEAIDDNDEVKFVTPLAAQLPGTGKTHLGLNIPSILGRPRDPPDVEAAIASRLKLSWCNRTQHNASVLVPQSSGDENIVMRTLLEAFPGQAVLLQQLKSAEPLLIRMKDLAAPEFGWSFEKAFAYAIFCAGIKLDQEEPETLGKFIAQDWTQQLPVGAVKAVMRDREGAPVFLLLDDITDLGNGMLKAYFKGEDGDVGGERLLHRAMTRLSVSLQHLHGLRGCFIYCTGPSLWLSTQALLGTSSPLFMEPVLLQPLTSADVMQILHLTRSADGRPMADKVGVDAGKLPYFAEAAVQLTGGVGRSLQFLLRTQESVAESAAKAGEPLQCASDEAVNEALEKCMKLVSSARGLKQLHVQWDGPSAAIKTGDLPAGADALPLKLQVLQLLTYLLLLDLPFSADNTVTLGFSQPVRVVDLAMTLGINYAPAEGGVRLVAGSWLCRSLAQEPLLARTRTLSAARMLDAMRTFSGSMRGRPFELLCADVMCFRHMMLSQGRLQQPPQPPRQRRLKKAPAAPAASLQPPTVPTLGDLLPHCRGTKLGGARLPQLNVVVAPKAVGYREAEAAGSGGTQSAGDGDAASNRQVAKLSMRVKSELLAASGRRIAWNPPSGSKHVIHADDLPWFLSEWLAEGSLAVPASSQSGSQDLILRLLGGAVGFALKAVGEPGTTWADLRDELGKAPRLSTSMHYVLVLWSLCLAPELREALGSAPHARFGQGSWVLVDQKLQLHRDGDGAEVKFTVPADMEILITNPHAPAGGGLAELLGNNLLQLLRSSPSLVADVQVLEAWMQAEAQSSGSE